MLADVETFEDPEGTGQTRAGDRISRVRQDRHGGTNGARGEKIENFTWFISFAPV